MFFLVPIALLGLLTLLVPIILHLIKQAKVTEVEWAAMDFLKKKEANSMQRRSLKNIPLLLARMLILLFIVFALARPIGSLFSLGKSDPTSILILLDRSPEMGAGKGDEIAIASALKEAQVALEDYGNDTRLYLLDSATMESIPVLSPKNLPLLAETKLVDAPASILEMISNALIELERSDYGQAELWVISSNLDSSWESAHSGWNGLKEKTLSNVKIRPFIHPAPVEDLSVALAGVNYSSQQLELELQIQGGEEGEVVLMSGRWEDGSEIQEEVVLTGSDTHILSLVPEKEQGGGVLSIPNDGNSANNEVFFAFGPPAEVWTLIVTDAPEERIAQDLKKAVALPSRPHQKVRTVSSEDAIYTDLSNFDLVVWAGNEESAKAREVIESFVKQGGVAIIFPSFEEGNHVRDWFLGDVVESPLDEFFSVEGWRQKDGPWKNARDGKPLPLSHLQSVVIAKTKVDAIPLATWSNGDPLLSQLYLGEGRLFTLSTLPTPSWSNMENLALHLVLFQRILQEAVTQGGGGYLQFIQAGREPFNAGLSSIGGRELAVNRPPRESEKQLSEGEIKKLLQSGELEVSSTEKRPRRPWVYPSLMMVLLFFIIESMIKIIPKLRSRKEAVSA